MTPSGKHAIFLLVMVLASTTVEAQREISILPFVPKADVGVTITRSPATVTVGEPLFFTIDVFNNGAQSTDAPFIFNAGNHHMDDGPTYTDIELVSGSGATVQNMYETNTGFRVTFINFIRGGRFTIRVKVVTHEPRTLTSTAVLTTTVQDPVPANNTAAVVTTVNPYFSNLSVTLSELPDVVVITQKQEISMEVVNNGPHTTDGVRMSFLGGGSVSIVNAQLTMLTDGTIVDCDVAGCLIDDFPSGGRARIRASLKPQALGLIKVTALVSGTELDPVPTDNVDTDGMLVEAGQAPIADAGHAFITSSLQVATLDARESQDPDGDELSYWWSFTERPPGSSAQLSNPVSARPSFIPDQRGRFVLRVIVRDGYHQSEDFIGVTVANTAPVAHAGRDQTVAVAATAALDGSGSTDIDSDELRYYWSFRSGPAGSGAFFSDALSVNPTFSPDLPGTYVLDLIVDDGEATSTDSVVISTVNSPPVANAGADVKYTGGVVKLNGVGSFDVDGDRIRFSWTFVGLPSGSAAAFDDRTSPYPRFTPDVAGTYIVQLVVSDPFQSSQDTVLITTGGAQPIARAGADRVVDVGATVSLNGSESSDAENPYSLHHIWSLVGKPAGSEAVLAPSGRTGTFVVDQPGTYVAQLFVHDGTNASAADTVMITTENLAPIAAAGSDRTTSAGQPVLLSGAASFDANEDSLSFRWAIIARPVARSISVPHLANAATIGPSFTADDPGLYILQLIVNDGVADSTPDTITIVVRE